MSTKDQGSGVAPSGEPPGRGNDRDSRPVPDAMLAMFFAALAITVVLGYLFLNRLVDISRQEDCMLSRSRNCAAIVIHSDH
jgi:hypothetical protein